MNNAEYKNHYDYLEMMLFMTSLKHYTYKIKMINECESFNQKIIPDNYKTLRDLIREKSSLLSEINEKDREIKSKDKKISLLEKELSNFKTNVFYKQSNI